MSSALCNGRWVNIYRLILCKTNIIIFFLLETATKLRKTSLKFKILKIYLAKFNYGREKISNLANVCIIVDISIQPLDFWYLFSIKHLHYFGALDTCLFICSGQKNGTHCQINFTGFAISRNFVYDLVCFKTI